MGRGIKKRIGLVFHLKAIITPDEKSVDIDDEFDFRLAKYKFKLLKNRIR